MKKKLIASIFIVSSFTLFTAAVCFGMDALEYIKKGIDSNVKGRYDEALEYFSSVIALKGASDTELMYAYYNRGNTYYNKNQFDKAIDDYRKAIKLNPKHAEAYVNLGKEPLQRYPVNGLNYNNWRSKSTTADTSEVAVTIIPPIS